MAAAPDKVTTATIRARKGAAERIAVVTAYDVVFARLADEAGIDVVLVGDSLGMVVQGERNTLAVTLDDIVYHTRIVSRGVRRAHLVADMPFMSYQASVEDGMRAAGPAAEGRAGGGGEAGGRRRGRGAGAPAGGRGHPGHGPRRADAAVGACVRRLQAAGPDDRAARAHHRGRTRGRGSRRVRDRRRDRAAGAGRRDHARGPGA